MVCVSPFLPSEMVGFSNVQEETFSNKVLRWLRPCESADSRWEMGWSGAWILCKPRRKTATFLICCPVRVAQNPLDIRCLNMLPLMLNALCTALYYVHYFNWFLTDVVDTAFSFCGLMSVRYLLMNTQTRYFCFIAFASVHHRNWQYTKV
jgi:hypothetical protein